MFTNQPFLPLRGAGSPEIPRRHGPDLFGKRRGQGFFVRAPLPVPLATAGRIHTGSAGPSSHSGHRRRNAAGLASTPRSRPRHNASCSVKAKYSVACLRPAFPSSWGTNPPACCCRGSGVSHAVAWIIVGQIHAILPRKGKLQHFHAGGNHFLSAVAAPRETFPQILGHDGQVSHGHLQRPEQVHAGALFPAAVCGHGLPAGMAQ